MSVTRPRRASKPITVSLGAQHAAVQRRLDDGLYESASEVIRAGLRALDREEAAFDQMLGERVRAALADPRLDIPGEDVFAALRQHNAACLRREKDEA